MVEVLGATELLTGWTQWRIVGRYGRIIVNRVVGRNGSLQLRRSGVISVQRVLICARNIRFVKLSPSRMRVESRLLIADQREFDAS